LYFFFLAYTHSLFLSLYIFFSHSFFRFQIH
jgi:hypothetical protein